MTRWYSPHHSLVLDAFSIDYEFHQGYQFPFLPAMKDIS